MSPHEEIRICTRQIERNPDDFEAYFNRGKAYQVLELYDLAIDDFFKAIQINKNYAEAYYWCGVAYVKLGNDKKAQAYFARARELGYNG